jgi:pSer/pThr/pTyr-binding forkhead associated (FHA) protein
VRAQNSRLRYLFLGGGFLAFGGLLTLFFIRLRKEHGFVEIVSGMDNGRRYNLDHEVVRIGAVAQDGSERNDIVVRDMERMVSRFHCEIHQAKGKFYLIDCNSANGTRIDKKTVPPEEPQRLRSGARVDLAGTVTLRFGLERRQKRRAS